MKPQPIKKISIDQKYPKTREVEMFVDSEETLTAVAEFGRIMHHNKSSGFSTLIVSGLYNFDEVVSYLENLQ